MKRTPEKPDRGGIRGDRIKELRQKRHLEQGQLAYRAGIDVSYIYRLEAGENPNVSALILSKIAVVLRTSTDYLVGTVDTDAPMPQTAIQRALAELPADFEDVIMRLAELDPERRDRVGNLIGELMNLVAEPEADEEDDEVSRLIRLLDNLPPERLTHWRSQIEAEAADQDGPESRAASRIG